MIVSLGKSKSSPTEYDDFYFLDEKNELARQSVSLLIERFSLVDDSVEKAKLYQKKYKDRLYCPECKNALLNFKYNSKTPYLSKNSNSNHADNCSHIHPLATKKETKEVLRKMSPEDKQRRLKSVVSNLIKDEAEIASTADNSDNDIFKDNPYVFGDKEKKSSMRRFNTKSVKRILTLSEEGIYIVYGKTT